MWHHENPDTQKKKELDELKKCLAKETGFRHTHTVLMYWQNRFFREKKKKKDILLFCKLNVLLLTNSVSH